MEIKRAIGMTIFILSIFFCRESLYIREEGIGGFTIKSVPNAHQLDSSVGYFYLKENLGEKDEIKVKLINESSKEKTLEIKVTDVNTNPNGIFDYTRIVENHALLKTSLTQFVKGNQFDMGTVMLQSDDCQEIPLKKKESLNTGVKNRTNSYKEWTVTAII